MKKFLFKIRVAIWAYKNVKTIISLKEENETNSTLYYMTHKIDNQFDNPFYTRFGPNFPREDD